MINQSPARRALAKRPSFMLGVIALLLALGQAPAMAATINVTPEAVDNTDNGNCSIVEAIRSANSDSAVDACTQGSGADTIILPAGATFTLSPATNADCFQGHYIINSAVTADLGYSVLPPITTPLTIEGNGSIIERDPMAGVDCRIITVIKDINNSGALTVNQATIRNGVVNLSAGKVADHDGGGLLDAGDVTLNRSTVSGNSAPGRASNGGGIATFNANSLTLNVSTVSGNTANSFGGGLFIEAGQITLANSSVVNNTGQVGGLSFYGGRVHLHNSLIAANKNGAGSPSNCDADGGGLSFDNSVNLTDDGRYTTGGASCGLTVKPNLVLKSADSNGTLGDLADNGGPTQTHALLPGSSAIDAADVIGEAFCSGLPVNGSARDQRGIKRPQDGDGDGTATCDVGAFELEGSGVGGAGALQFSVADFSVGEGDGTATITVTRDDGTTGTVTVDYASVDTTGAGTATAIADYTPVTGTLTFADGDTQKSFTVPIIDDSEVEGDETVKLALSNPTDGAALGTRASTVLTIVDNDFTPTERIQQLTDDINDSALPDGVKSNLTAPLNRASKFLNDTNPHNDRAVCGQLNAFTNQVNASERRGQITAAQADQLREAATDTIRTAGCKTGGSDKPGKGH